MPRPLIVLGAVLLLALGAAALASAKGSATHEPGVLGHQWWLFAAAALAVGITAMVKLRERMSATEPSSTAGARLHRGVLAVAAVLTAAVPVALFLVRTQPPATQTACLTECINLLSTSKPSAQQETTRPLGLNTAHHSTFRLPLGLILAVLGIGLAILIAAAVIAMLLRLRRATETDITGAPAPALAEEAEDESALGAAILAGRGALEGEARAAIIACYAAMEESLTQAGVPRLESDSPADLLTRATQRGVVDGPAPRRLARLFREARFSTHPMTDEDLEHAREALDAIVAQLGVAAQ